MSKNKELNVCENILNSILKDFPIKRITNFIVLDTQENIELITNEIEKINNEPNKFPEDRKEIRVLNKQKLKLIKLKRNLEKLFEQLELISEI